MCVAAVASSTIVPAGTSPGSTMVVTLGAAAGSHTIAGIVADNRQGADGGRLAASAGADPVVGALGAVAVQSGDALEAVPGGRLRTVLDRKSVVTAAER